MSWSPKYLWKRICWYGTHLPTAGTHPLLVVILVNTYIAGWKHKEIKQAPHWQVTLLCLLFVVSCLCGPFTYSFIGFTSICDFNFFSLHSTNLVTCPSPCCTGVSIHSAASVYVSPSGNFPGFIMIHLCFIWLIDWEKSATATESISHTTADPEIRASRSRHISICHP